MKKLLCMIPILLSLCAHTYTQTTRKTNASSYATSLLARTVTKNVSSKHRQKCTRSPEALQQDKYIKALVTYETILKENKEWEYIIAQAEEKKCSIL